ncbi:MAG: 2-keto-4-pentenoate hydratase [Pikeienuella sp.]
MTLSLNERIPAAAEALANLRLRRGIVPPIPDLPEEIRPRTMDEAYQVQAVLAELLEKEGFGPVAGWKIGLSNKVMQEYIGIDHPAAGAMHVTEMRESGAMLRTAEMRKLGLECEIAVRLSSDLAPGGDAAAAIGGVMTSIEIVEERFEDFKVASKESMIADDFFSRGCVLGEEVELAEAGDLKTLAGGFSVNGEAPEFIGEGTAILGDPLTALGWLAGLKANDGGLKAGVVVTLGSVVKTIYPEPGQIIEAMFNRLPPVTVFIK